MFISVKEAMELTGMSSTSIYRLCNKRINTLYVRKEDNKFLIDKEFILAAYPPDIVKATEQSDTESNSVVQEPEFEVVQTKNTETSLPIVLDEKALITNESSDINEITDHKDEIQLITLNQKSQVDANVLGNGANVVEQKASLVENKANIAERNAEVNDKDSYIVAGNEQVVTETKSSKYLSLDTLIGIAASLLLIGALIYLIYLEGK